MPAAPANAAEQPAQAAPLSPGRAAAILKQCGACAAGCVSYARVAGRIAPEQRGKIEKQMPWLRSLVCAAFPYYAGAPAGNLSLYARGMDYHQAVGARLRQACGLLEAACGLQPAVAVPSARFLPFVDVSPFPEVYAAACAGVGVLGQNGLLLTREYGSYVFLGIIATSLELDSGAQPQPCCGCGACIRACPQQALGKGSGPARAMDDCLSELTQRRGELEPAQRAAVRAHPLVWGCDICQEVCPMNQTAKKTPLPEFCQDLIATLAPEDVDLSDRAFRKKYAGRAFSWRGVQPLKRNLHDRQE